MTPTIPAAIPRSSQDYGFHYKVHNLNGIIGL